MVVGVWSVVGGSARGAAYSGINGAVERVSITDFVSFDNAIAAIFLVFAGIKFMTSGNDMMQRDNAKSMIGYVVIGLIVIWAAPFVVQLFAS